MSKEVSQADRDQDRLLAASFVGGLWAAVRSVNGPRPLHPDYHHLQGVFDPAWLRTLTLPIGQNRPASQIVSLGENMSFERHFDEAGIEQAYARQPRTKIYESVETRSGRWMAEATRYLMELAGCDVVCTVYESEAEDKTLGPHKDGWYGAILQMTGAKAWYLGEDVQRRKPTVVAEAGDVLIVPPKLLHDVSTPDYSVHMTVAMLVDGYDWMEPLIEAGKIVRVVEAAE